MTQYDAERTGVPLSPQMQGARGHALVDPALIRVGMEVIGLNGGLVGRVKEVHAHDFWVDRTFQRDIYVPFGAVQDVVGNQVVLDVVTGHVDSMGWDAPIVTGEDKT